MSVSSEQSHSWRVKFRNKKKAEKEEKRAGERNCGRGSKGSRSADNGSSVLVSLRLAARFTCRKLCEPVGRVRGRRVGGRDLKKFF